VYVHCIKLKDLPLVTVPASVTTGPVTIMSNMFSIGALVTVG
jgi:hypothetical protein